MPDDVEMPPSPRAPAPRRKSPGRPRLVDKETPKQRIERLKAELEKAQEADQKAELTLASIVGAVVVTHARADKDFRRQLAGLLRDKIKNKADLAAVAEFLA